MTRSRAWVRKTIRSLLLPRGLGLEKGGEALNLFFGRRIVQGCSELFPLRAVQREARAVKNDFLGQTQGVFENKGRPALSEALGGLIDQGLFLVGNTQIDGCGGGHDCSPF